MTSDLAKIDTEEFAALLSFPDKYKVFIPMALDSRIRNWIEDEYWSIFPNWKSRSSMLRLHGKVNRLCQDLVCTNLLYTLSNYPNDQLSNTIVVELAEYVALHNVNVILADAPWADQIVRYTPIQVRRKYIIRPLWC